MTRYSVQPRDQIFVKVYAFLSFAKNMGRNSGKNISTNLSSKHSQKLLDIAKQSATDAFKTASKRAIKKTVETTCDLIGNKTTDRITKVSKTSSKNNSEKNEEEILREGFIPPELRHTIIEVLRLRTEYYWWFKISIIIQYNNGISKNNKFIRQYIKSTN